MFQSNKIWLIILCAHLYITVTSQDCHINITGTIEDSGTHLPLELVNIFVVESQSGTSTNEDGQFVLNNLCQGDLHIILSHIGCESKTIFIELQRDTILDFSMDHSEHILHHIEITGEPNLETIQETDLITEQNIVDNANQNLSKLIESIVGVSSLKNGNGISKPVVNGLFGNRLTILNNGISQSGQQWGNDHSPEIDPLVANKIKVIKGTSALEYMGSNLGSVVLIEPDKIEREPHVHGRAKYFFESNGLGHGLNLQLQQYNEKLAWKVNGTLKKAGDRKTPNYYLNNTGIEEANIAIQLEKSFSEHFHSDIYFSSFNTNLGVLRGSHIGNLSDLSSALQQDIPFFTEEDFSYQIDAPKQAVNHQLLKIHSKYFINDHEWIDITLSGQINNRKEFDIRRSGRSDIPALSLKQYSFFIEPKYEKEFDNHLSLKSGIQFNFIDNANQADTGILPLIPDYFAYETGIYSIIRKELDKSIVEFGLRYDNVIQKVVTISQTSSIERFDNNFNNYNASAGWNYSLTNQMSLALNLGYATRNPAINELYSFGLHQGVSGIEQGNNSLLTEKSLKSTLGFQYKNKTIFTFESLLYFQSIANYISLIPQDEFRQTIRGIFPVFRYEQTDARIYGLDISTKYELTQSIHAKLDYSYIRGNDISIGIPLINIPSNSITGIAVFAFPKSIQLRNTNIENIELELNNQFVFRQNRLNADQDYVTPPEGYNLFGIQLAGNIQLKRTRIRLTTSIDNLLNVAYRDYLNRQRYFADDLGRNIVFGIQFKF